MKQKIRTSVFETNSSSTHSLVIDDKNFVLDTILPNDEGIIYIESGHFGWEWEKYNDARIKASYLYTASLESYYESKKEEIQERLISVISGQTLANNVVLVPEDSSSWGAGIDHQSIEDGQLDNVLFDESIMKNFIFNENSTLYLGNDNDDAFGFYS